MVMVFENKSTLEEYAAKVQRANSNNGHYKANRETALLSMINSKHSTAGGEQEKTDTMQQCYDNRGANDVSFGNLIQIIYNELFST